MQKSCPVRQAVWCVGVERGWALEEKAEMVYLGLSLTHLVLTKRIFQSFVLLENSQLSIILFSTEVYSFGWTIFLCIKPQEVNKSCEAFGRCGRKKNNP